MIRRQKRHIAGPSRSRQPGDGRTSRWGWWLGFSWMSMAGKFLLQKVELLTGKALNSILFQQCHVWWVWWHWSFFFLLHPETPIVEFLGLGHLVLGWEETHFFLWKWWDKSQDRMVYYHFSHVDCNFVCPVERVDLQDIVTSTRRVSGSLPCPRSQTSCSQRSGGSWPYATYLCQKAPVIPARIVVSTQVAWT